MQILALTLLLKDHDFINNKKFFFSFEGKTLLAKAVAHSTSATFIRATGADLIQKNSGDGSKLVR